MERKVLSYIFEVFDFCWKQENLLYFIDKFVFQTDIFWTHDEL